MGYPAQLQNPRAERFPLTVPVYFRKTGASHWLDGTTVNISRTGILFKADEIFLEDSLLDIRVEFPSDSTLECQGSVVRTGRSRMAVRLHHPSLNHHR